MARDFNLYFYSKLVAQGGGGDLTIKKKSLANLLKLKNLMIYMTYDVLLHKKTFSMFHPTYT